MFRACVLCGALFLSSAAHALCVAPVPPLGGPPSPPFCSLDGRFRTPCDRWEVERFRDRIDAHLRAVEAYAEAAARYARCEADAALAAWHTFATR